MYDCPTCSGTGEISVEVCTIVKIPGVEKTSSISKLTCVDCDGAGLVTMTKMTAISRRRAAMNSFWCQCGNQSGAVSYHPDSPESKHHWTCDDCGKVVQVG